MPVADFIHLKVRSAYSLTEGANKLELALNRKTLQAFGVTIPPTLAVRADRVFEGIGE